MIYESRSVDDTEKIAEGIAKSMPPPRVFCLDGDLGAGKTAFARGLARGYGYEGRVTSPTFTIFNIYEGKTAIHHFDLYRVNSEDELFDLGFDSYLDDGIAIVEWYNKFEHLFDKNAVRVSIKRGASETERIIEISDTPNLPTT